MPSVLLVTFNLMPEGEPGGAVLVPALAERGIDARWVCWDDPAVDWSAADLVSVRSTWDYHRRVPAFLAWAREVEAVTPVLNGAEVFAWNVDKAYLVELAEVMPVVPTAVLDDATLISGLTAALERWGTVVIKPCVGAGGRGVVVVEGLDDWRLFDLAPSSLGRAAAGRVGAHQRGDVGLRPRRSRCRPGRQVGWLEARSACTRCTAAAAGRSRSTRVAPGSPSTPYSRPRSGSVPTSPMPAST